MSKDILSNVEVVDRDLNSVLLGDYNRLKLSSMTFDLVKKYSDNQKKEEIAAVEPQKLSTDYQVVQPASVATLNEPAKGLRVSPKLVTSNNYVSEPTTPVYQAKTTVDNKEEMMDRVKITGRGKDLNGKMEYFSRSTNEIDVNKINQEKVGANVNTIFTNVEKAETKPLYDNLNIEKSAAPVNVVELDKNINDNNLIKFKADAEEVKMDTPNETVETNKSIKEDVFSVLKRVEESSPVQPSISSASNLTKVEALKKLKEELEAEKQRKIQLELEQTQKIEILSKYEQEAEEHMKKLISQQKNDNASLEKKIQNLNKEQEEFDALFGEYKNQETPRTR